MKEYKKLCEVCDINMGQSPDSNSYNTEREGLPFFQGNADFGDLYPYVRMWCNNPKKIVEQGTLLISVRAPIGALNFASEKSCIGRGLAGITTHSDMELKYIYYCLKAKHGELNRKGTGSTFKAISKNVLGSIEIEYISLDAQRKCIAILDKLNEVICKKRKQIERIDELIKSRFIEMFGDPMINSMGWKTDKAEKHIDVLSGFPFDSSQYTESGVKICGGLIIMPQKINWNDCKYWNSTEGYEDYKLQVDDIVMALDRPWISEGFKIAMVDSEHLPALLIQRTARIRAIDIDQHYLMYCFILGGFNQHCNVTGSLVPHISLKDICSFTLMLPPYSLQEQFAAFVAQTDKSKLIIQKSLDELETLNKALMQKYFGGNGV